jgi:D-glycero-D-manno-heptose 1,7-bisphosphate phosphatase
VARERPPGSAAAGVLLDRDGVINRERPDYVKRWDEFEFLPGAIPALRRLAAVAWPIVVITNQSAIGRGLATAEDVADIHRRMAAAVAAAGGGIDAILVCPHQPRDACACRKPRARLLERAAEAFQLRLRDCFFVGDALSDLQAARAAGCRPILVRSGLQGPRLPHLLRGEPGVPLVADLPSAVAFMLDQAQTVRRSGKSAAGERDRGRNE